jgi:hypothetical protein
MRNKQNQNASTVSNKPANAMMRQGKVTVTFPDEDRATPAVRNCFTENGCCLLRVRISAHLGRYNRRCWGGRGCFRRPIWCWRGRPGAYRTSVLFKKINILVNVMGVAHSERHSQGGRERQGTQEAPSLASVLVQGLSRGIL